MHEVLPTKEIHLSLVSRALITHVSDPRSISFRDQTDTVWPMTPTVNHTVNINYLTWHKTSGKQRHSQKTGCFKGLEVVSQELGNNQTFPWNV